MKLLVLIHRLPCPADRGSKLRAAVELRYLARRHDVWCAGFDDVGACNGSDPAGCESFESLREICRDIGAVRLSPLRANLRAMHRLMIGSTATEGYFYSRRLEAQVMKWANEIGFDAVLACSSSMAPLALKVPAKRRVLDFVDLDSRKWVESVDRSTPPMSWIYATEARRLARREREWMQLFDASVLCTERETALLTDEMPRDRIHVIETGAWCDPNGASSDGSPVSLTDEPVVGFLGAMDYQPNIDAACWFAESIWPQVSMRCDSAEWWVVGRSPAPAVRRLDDGGRVHVTGTVPAVEPYLRRMRVNVAPLRLARGLQTKVLTAMASGLPCVVTSCVAEGLGAEPGRELLVADTTDEFAGAVVRLLRSKTRAEEIGAAGRDFVARKYRPDESLPHLERLLAG